MKKINAIILTVLFLFIGCVSVKAATLKSGTYTIESSLSEQHVLDVAGGKTTNGTNVQLHISNKTKAQQWKVEELSNGYYKITSLLANNMVLDVAGASKKNGANVQLHISNNTAAQQWTIKYVGGGYYSIISKCNGLYIDVRSASVYNGNNIQMHAGNNTKAQKFRFIEMVDKEKTLDSGNYRISSVANDSNFIDTNDSNISSKTNIYSNASNDSWTQIWHLTYLNNGYYKITSSISDGASMSVASSSALSGTNVQISNSSNDNNQQWIIKKNDDNTYSIVSKLGHDNMFIDISGGSKLSGANIQIHVTNGSDAQKFVFTKTDEKVVQNGLYTISNKQSNKKLRIDNDKLNNCTNIKFSNDNDTNGQKWNITYVGGGYYSIFSGFNNNYSLDITGGSSVSGTNLQLHQSNKSAAQLWKFKYIDGHYVIYSKINSLAIDMGDSLEDDSFNTVVKTKTDEDSQHYKLEQTELNDTVPNYDNADIQEGYYNITSALNDKMAIDVSGGVRTNGNNIQMYTSTTSLNQIWYIKKLSNGYYNVTSALNPNITLDVTGGKGVSGTNIQIHVVNGSDAQSWLIKDLGDGYYTFVSKLGNLAIDVSSTSIKNGTNVLNNKLTYNPSQRFKLKPNNSKKTYTGIDVSSWQYGIDWAKVAKSNVGFVIIRAGFGGEKTSNPLYNQDDSRFQEYVKGCETYNIPYAIYLYSYAYKEEYAQQEVNHTIRQLNAIKAKKYAPNLSTKVFLDVEDSTMANVSKTSLTKTVNDYCSKMETSGYKCGIYANANWFKNHLDTKSLAKKYTIWLAEWPKNNTVTSYYNAVQMTPAYSLTNYKFWQFSSNGAINGISVRVDLDIGYDIFD